MTRRANVLYPEGYTEPVVLPPSQEGRDFAEVKRLMTQAVPLEGRPLTLAQIAPIVLGRPARPGMPTLRVGVDPIGHVRARLLDGLGGLIASPATVSVRRSELDAVFAEIVAERLSSWTFQHEIVGDTPETPGEPGPR